MKFIACFMLLVSQLAFGQMRPGPNPRPLPTPEPDFKQSTLCQQTCVGTTHSLYFMTITSQSNVKECPTQMPTSVHSCAPYSCENNGKWCKTSCGADTDCAPGFLCQAGSCTSISYYCADNQTVVGSNGQSFNCWPFVCQAGKCKERCGSTDDCAPGTVCDFSNNNTCVVPPPPGK